MDRVRVGAPAVGQHSAQIHPPTSHANTSSSSPRLVSSPGAYLPANTALSLPFSASSALLEYPSQPVLSGHFTQTTANLLTTASSPSPTQLIPSVRVPPQGLSPVPLGVFCEDTLFTTRLLDLHAQHVAARRSLAAQLRQLRRGLLSDNCSDGTVDSGDRNVSNGTSEAIGREEYFGKFLTEAASTDLSKHVSRKLKPRSASELTDFRSSSASTQSAIPPLLAELYFRNEFIALFRNKFSMTSLSSAASQYDSLARANVEFNAFAKTVARRWPSEGCEHKFTFSCHSPRACHPPVVENHHQASWQKKVICCASRSLLPHNNDINHHSSPAKEINNFQRRTFYRSRERADERFTPSAPCIEDRLSGAVAPFGAADHATTPLSCMTSSDREFGTGGTDHEYWVYSVPLNARGLPRYTSNHSVPMYFSSSTDADQKRSNVKFLPTTHSASVNAPSSSPVLSTPAFQRRTNYPFRATPSTSRPFNQCSCASVYQASHQHTCTAHHLKTPSPPSVSRFPPSVAARLRERLIIENLSEEAVCELKSLLSSSRGRYFDPGDDDRMEPQSFKNSNYN